MPLIKDIQVLEPGSEVLLFELDGSDYGADVLRFHGHAIPYTAAELIAAGADADQLPAKAIWWQGNEYGAWPMQIDGIETNGDGTAVRPTLSVGNVNGRITALCLAFDDLLEFKLTMQHTLGRYLDAQNFPEGNAEADPTQASIEIWYVDQKTNEDGESVTWDCGYTGGYVDKDGNPTDDPEKDECDATLARGCEPRFGANNELPFGGFPAVSLIARS
jgi:lambda family phage minor tail protein L